MTAPILATKLHIPPPRPKVVRRSHLIERLNEGLLQDHGFGCKLIRLSASAGFGQTTLISEWVAGCGRPVAWLSLDAGDNDPARFLGYLIAALQTVFADIGAGVLAAVSLRGQKDTAGSGQETLEYLERANLFVVPLDNERRWYCYSASDKDS